MAEAGHHQLRHADGTWKHTNALANETSPYLLQHAHNPVDWHPWGPAAFELARKQNKPIFLSIGYSTCYWCHVMERQVFESEAIAEQMNRHFVNIKVDREERPDVDDIYMLAVQIMTGHGGWPMSVFLTPPGSPGSPGSANGADRGLKPFYAGTYFPPEPMHGRPGFPQILEALADAWQNKRQDVLDQGTQIAESVREHLGRVDEPGDVGPDLVAAAANRLLRSYDPEHGGFGQAPKFPTPSNLFFLLTVYQNNPNSDLWDALSHTLDRMARGGMYDQIGGGFHRYSTDEKWLVPHFEKMLYDNGQLVEAYLIAQTIKPDKNEPGLYERIVRQTCDYVMREMSEASGGFWSAQDAEVDTLEGGNYLWRPPEIEEAITDPKRAALAKRMYGLDLGENFQDPHHPEVPPTNVLYLPIPLNELAQKEGMSLEALLREKEQIDATLFAARNQRKQPGTDDKVLTAWNGMMIAGMARAGRQLNEPKYTEAAALAARAILDLMKTEDGQLQRSMRKGESKINAFLDDYAFFIHGLVELYRATSDAFWKQSAEELTRLVERLFVAPPGGYFDTLENQADLFVRTRSTYDGAVPSGNSQMVHDLLDLHELTQKDEYLDRAIRDLKSFADPMRRHGSGMAHMQGALLRALDLAPERFGGSRMASADAGGKRPVVSVDVSPKSVNTSGGPAKVTVTLVVGPDYHLNAHDPAPGSENLIPTVLELQGGGYELKVDYPPGKEKKYPFADKPIRVYEGTVKLEATIRSTAAPAPGNGGAGAKPTLVLRYQVCTEMSCLEPREAVLPVHIDA